MRNLLRSVRRRFGISAPKMTVRTHLAWYWRWTAMVLFASVSLALAAWIYDAGMRFAGFDRSEIEHGAENRFMILNKMAERTPYAELPQLHLFMTEVVAIAKDLDSFDALLCALSLAEGRPVVGYELGESLTAAKSAGFKAVGSLNVWTLPAA